MAGGTGDIALRALDRGGPGCSAVLCDISPEMLGVGRRRVEKAGRGAQVDVVQGNAEALPFPDRSFDAYTIAFGIRNVTHIDRALAEAFRVLKIGGRFLCLEFSQVQVPILDKLYDLHSFHVIPRLGQLTAGAAEPYQYLVESIRKFPSQETVRRDDPRRRLRARQLPQPDRRRRRDPQRLEDLEQHPILRNRPWRFTDRIKLLSTYSLRPATA